MSDQRLLLRACWLSVFLSLHMDRRSLKVLNSPTGPALNVYSTSHTNEKGRYSCRNHCFTSHEEEKQIIYVTNTSINEK